MIYLQDFVNFCCQVVKIVHGDELSLYNSQLAIAFSHCLLRRTLTMKQVHCKLSRQIHLHNSRSSCPAPCTCDFKLSELFAVSTFTI